MAGSPRGRRRGGGCERGAPVVSIRRGLIALATSAVAALASTAAGDPGSSAPPVTSAIPGILGGDPGPRGRELLRVTSDQLKPSFPALEAIPLAPLNRETGPELTAHMSGELRTQVNALRLALGRALLPAGPPLASEPGLRTLDATLTTFQQALLGCGPFFGTRCDGAVRIDPLGERDGIDFPNADASALEQAWPGRPLFGSPRFGRSLFSWATLGARRQPGTAEVVDASVMYRQSRAFGPSCSRPDGHGRSIPLPGCRGIEAIYVARDPTSQQVLSVEIAFEDGYRPSVDGCLVGGSVEPEAPLQVIGRLGADIETGAGGVDVVLVANSRGYLPDATEIRQCHTGGYQTPLGSSWLWHPVAGCLDEERARHVENFGDANVDPEDGSARFGDCGTILVNGTPTTRSFVDRFQDFNQDGILDIEQEFLGTLERTDCDDPGVCVPTAQLFRNELAVLSWNLLQFLVTTSCSEDERGAQEIRGDPRCFDPAQALRADRCSFNAPQLCLNLLEDASIPVEIQIESPAPPMRSRRTLAIAVLGSQWVEVGAIDPASLGLGPRAAAPVGRRPEYRDVNGDGRLDLVAHFPSWGMGLARPDAPLCLGGEIAGFPFEGCAAIETAADRWDLRRRSLFGSGSP